MKNIILLTVIIFITVACSKHTKTVFTDNQGHQIVFSALHGKWVFINYWATWCTACMAEIPELNKFYQTHQNRVIVLGVNYDSLNPSALNNAITQFRIIFPVLTTDPAKILHLSNAGVVPTTYVFNPQGNLVKILLGPQTKNKLDDIIGKS